MVVFISTCIWAAQIGSDRLLNKVIKSMKLCGEIGKGEWTREEVEGRVGEYDRNAFYEILRESRKSTLSALFLQILKENSAPEIHMQMNGM